MTNFLISLILSGLLSLIAYIKKAMTNTALILAFIFSVIITYFGGVDCYTILVLVFIGTVIGSKINHNKGIKILKNINEKTGKKDIFQIIANVGLGTFMILIYGLTKNDIYLVVYASIMSESLSDTLASDIGVLSKRAPINIKTLKKSTPGLSGNISLLGTCASLIGAFIIGITFYIFNSNLINIFIITISGFIGALFDSILGAIFQVKYKCRVCSTITELKMHCNNKTNYYKGNKKVNNDLVNFLSNFIAGIISLLIIKLI